MPWDEIDEPDEAAFMAGRREDFMYTSKSFTVSRPYSSDFGEPARYVYKVYDDNGEYADVDVDGNVWSIDESEAGRVQTKFLLAREDPHVKDIWIQKIRKLKDGTEKCSTVFHLGGPKAEAFIDLVKSLDFVPMAGGQTTRIDDAVLRMALADPDAVRQAYRADPEGVRTLIANDADARDAIAFAHRRKEVERFRRLLSDDTFFEDQRVALGLRGKEAVWQRFFEDNAWILGLNLTGQLLTSWDETRLEQVVSGFSVAGPGKRVDGLLRTAGAVRSMVFAEIKHHKTELLDPASSPYRPGCWGPSKELAGGIAQAQATVHSAVASIGQRIQGRASDGSEIPDDVTFLFQPRSFLIAGRLDSLFGEQGGLHPEKVRSFELLRRNTVAPEVMTYDELLARAEWLTRNDGGTLVIEDEPEPENWF